MGSGARVLVVACGALAGELIQLKRMNDWAAVEVRCLPADLHNRPERIAPALEKVLETAAAEYDRVVIGYADCGTGGGIDRVADRFGAVRIPGAHCYEFYAGQREFRDLADAEVGTFYLTDYLARNFQRLVVRGMGIEKHPELKSMLFGNYRKLVYLAQQPTAELERSAREAAEFLELEYARVDTGLSVLGGTLQPLLEH